MSSAKVLYVEDEMSFHELLIPVLEGAGFACLSAFNGREALEKAEAFQPDVVVLDLRLPKMDGWEVCKRLRAKSSVGIIVLTALLREEVKQELLTLGADKVLTKPLGPKTLIASIEALLWRMRGSKEAEGDVLRFDGLEIDLENTQVLLDGGLVDLTPKEFDILCYLAQNPNKLLTDQTILDKVWGEDFFETHYVHKNVSAIRHKLHDPPENPRFIKTVRGRGYRFMGK